MHGKNERNRFRDPACELDRFRVPAVGVRNPMALGLSLVQESDGHSQSLPITDSLLALGLPVLLSPHAEGWNRCVSDFESSFLDDGILPSIQNASVHTNME